MAQNNVQPNPMGGQVRTVSGINVLLGVWLIISPWIINYAILNGPLWNSVIVGVIVIVLAGIRVANPLQYAWLSWVNLVLGLWLIISPWVYNYASLTGPMWNSVIVGIVIAVLSIWSAMAAR